MKIVKINENNNKEIIFLANFKLEIGYRIVIKNPLNKESEYYIIEGKKEHLENSKINQNINIFVVHHFVKNHIWDKKKSTDSTYKKKIEKMLETGELVLLSEKNKKITKFDDFKKMMSISLESLINDLL